jgi:hypothetical protein
MFRKGGEVMEGIMTGIKPRKMFSAGTFSEEDQEMIGDVRRKMNLINAVGGGSGLSDPLTQFLLTAGPDLVAGKGAGGTKLQEILGGVKPGLDQAIKTQQLKDLSDRKLATSLIAKSKIGSAEQAWKDYGQYSGMTKPDFIREYAQKELFKKKTNPEDRFAQKERDTATDLGKYKDFLRNPKYNPLQKNRIVSVITELEKNPQLEAQVDVNNPFISKDDYEAAAPVKVKTGEGKIEERKVIVPNDKDDFQPNLKYFVVDANAFFYYDAKNNRLIEVPN